MSNESKVKEALDRVRKAKSVKQEEMCLEKADLGGHESLKFKEGEKADVSITGKIPPNVDFSKER